MSPPSDVHLVFWKGPRESERSATLKRRHQDTRGGWMLDFFVGQLLALERVVGCCSSLVLIWQHSLKLKRKCLSLVAH